MYIKLPEFFNHLKSEKPKTFYIFTGQEDYLKEQALVFLQNKLKTDLLNREVFYATDTPLSTILSSIYTVPFFSQTRLVIVKQAQKFKIGDQEELSELISDFPTSSCLILFWQDKVSKQGKKNLLLSRSEEIKAVIDFRSPYDNELPSWVQKEVLKLNKNISYNTAQYLIAETGNVLYDLKNEIDKLDLFIAQRKEITVSDIQNISGHSKQFNLFNLSEAVETKNLKDAIFIIEKLINEGELPSWVLNAVYRTIKKLFLAKSLLLERKYSFSQIEKELGLHPFFDKNFFKNLQKFSLEELQSALALILYTDLELKSTTKPESMLIGNLVLSLGRNRTQPLQ